MNIFEEFHLIFYLNMYPFFFFLEYYRKMGTSARRAKRDYYGLQDPLSQISARFSIRRSTASDYGDD